ncbi:MAG: PEP-CTERM sorting domain-containing protein [Verrucomicrobiaceae bacterium]|nr:PEP-CTERM sorting domain-containing protein [Verrucomicrobiaceae bacterium]
MPRCPKCPRARPPSKPSPPTGAAAPRKPPPGPYDNTGAVIYAGLLAVPEPSRALLLGMIGATFRRRCQR